ncbi:hypothetical protein [Streptomyces sp. NPDC002722]|uniref:hypothetical protein n=1 Tax=Streptomyces sp. NPDC002722 TaxID=3154425 RepID=UPI00333091AA
MAQRTPHLTRRCPDKEVYGRFELDMNSRLDRLLTNRTTTVPGPRAPGGEAAVAPA